MASPRPVPPNRRVVELSACSKAWEEAVQLFRAEADAGVPYFDVDQDVARHVSRRRRRSPPTPVR